jgi:hypothetical protein
MSVKAKSDPGVVNCTDGGKLWSTRMKELYGEEGGKSASLGGYVD